METFGLLCGSSDNLVIVFQHSNVHQPSGNNIPTAKCACYIPNSVHIAYIACIPNTATQRGRSKRQFLTPTLLYRLFYSSNKIRKAQIEHLSIVKNSKVCTCEFNAYFLTYWDLYYLIFDLESIEISENLEHHLMANFSEKARIKMAGNLNSCPYYLITTVNCLGIPHSHSLPYQKDIVSGRPHT